MYRRSWVIFCHLTHIWKCIPLARLDAPRLVFYGVKLSPWCMILRWNLSKIWSQELQLPLNTSKPCLAYFTQLTRTWPVAAMRVTKLMAVTSSSSCDQPFYIVWPVAPRGCIFVYGLCGKNDHPWPPLHTLKVCNISSLTPCIRTVGLNSWRKLKVRN
jgi:hypothetical protein